MAKELNTRHLGYGLKDEEWGIYCTSVDTFDEVPAENLSSFTGRSAAGRVIKEYQFIYLTAGAGMFRDAEVKEKIEAGTLLTIFPDLRHWIEPDRGTLWSGSAVSFAGSHVDDLIASKFFTLEAPVHRIGIREQIVSTFARIAETAETEPPCFQHVLGALVLELFAIVLSCDVSRTHDETEVETMEKAKAILLDHMYKRVDMEQVAEALSMGYKNFCDLFRSYTGLTPYQYFLNMKINKAKELLSEGTLSVKEVSYKLAFQTPYYFSRFFKIKTGTPPSKWNGLDLEDL